MNLCFLNLKEVLIINIEAFQIFEVWRIGETYERVIIDLEAIKIQMLQIAKFSKGKLCQGILIIVVHNAILEHKLM